MGFLVPLFADGFIRHLQDLSVYRLNDIFRQFQFCARIGCYDASCLSPALRCNIRLSHRAGHNRVLLVIIQSRKFQGCRASSRFLPATCTSGWHFHHMAIAVEHCVFRIRVRGFDHQAGFTFLIFIIDYLVIRLQYRRQRLCRRAYRLRYLVNLTAGLDLGILVSLIDPVICARIQVIKHHAPGQVISAKHLKDLTVSVCQNILISLRCVKHGNAAFSLAV